MNNNLSVPKGSNPIVFKRYFLEYLGANLSEKLCDSLANLLAIDYAGRMKSEVDLDHHITQCALRIKKNIGLKVITDESFASVMQLFIIAITPERDIDTDNHDLKKQSHDALIDCIIAAYFHDLSHEETVIIKSLIKEILNEKDGKEILNTASTNPKLFYSIIVSAIREKNELKDLLSSVRLHLQRVNYSNKERLQRKNITNKIVLISGLLIAASAGLIVGGIILSAFVFPAAALAIKFAPKISNKISLIKSQANEQTISRNIANNKENKIEISEQKFVEKQLDKQKVQNTAKWTTIKNPQSNFEESVIKERQTKHKHSR